MYNQALQAKLVEFGVVDAAQTLISEKITTLSLLVCVYSFLSFILQYVSSLLLLQSSLTESELIQLKLPSSQLERVRLLLSALRCPPVGSSQISQAVSAQLPAADSAQTPPAASAPPKQHKPEDFLDPSIQCILWKEVLFLEATVLSCCYI